jgi:hypothetical protein
MRRMTEPTPLDYFREEHLAAIRERAQEVMAEHPPPQELIDIPDSLTKEEKTLRQRQLSQWKMDKYNRAARELVQEAKDSGEWAQFEESARQAKLEIKPPHIQHRNRDRAFTLLETMTKYFYQNLGVRLLIGYGYKDFDNPGQIIVNM